MNVGVLGLWHLGTVMAACLAQTGLSVRAFDEPQVVESLAARPPVAEPGLVQLIDSGLASGNLKLCADLEGLRQCSLLIVAYDTPVDDSDRADTEFVFERIMKALPHLPGGATVLISSQVPVGFTERVERQAKTTLPDKQLHFAYSPENLRLGQAIDCFQHPERIIIGCRSTAARQAIEPVLGAFCQNLIWMSIASAEMTKHALNAFLGLSIAFMNEVAGICEVAGADAGEVELGLKSEPRVGSRAPLAPGSAFAGGTLARDINFLVDVAQRSGRSTALLESIAVSNEQHKNWALERLRERSGALSGKVVAVLGLAYKPGTDTLRRSSSIELCRALAASGAVVQAHDPIIERLPDELKELISLKKTVPEALAGACALVVATACPQYKEISAATLVEAMNEALVLDANGFLRASLAGDARVKYIVVGRA